MKSSLRLSLIALLFAIVSPAVAGAQITETMKFTTTFPFSVGKVNFGPGTYEARPLDDETRLICIRGIHGGPVALVTGIGERPRHEPTLSEVTFVREGNKLVLKSLWDESESEGLDVLPRTTVPVLAN